MNHDDADVAVPLCVDLDGTLTPVDTLHESLIALARKSPLALLRLPAVLGGGRAALKSYVVDQLSGPVGGTAPEIVVPLRQDFVDWLRSERASGRRLVLATASERRVAEVVAAQAGCFDEILATEGTTNLKAESKRDALEARFGRKGFDYCGNDRVDLPVLAAARRAIVVNASPATLAAAQKQGNVDRVFAPQRAGLKVWFKAMRLHQWVKNVLLFLPILLAHLFTVPSALLDTLVAFFAFGFCASSVYLLNDLLDLPSDRRHPRKRFRPFASGALPAAKGVLVAAALLVGSAVLAVQVTPLFVGVLAFYYVTTLAYSFKFKRYALIDVMLLAGLYTLRIIAGSAAAGVPLSFWLLAFSIFLFLSLGIIKRYTELALMEESPGKTLHGRGYGREDMALLLGLGASAGFVAVLVLALYINSPESTSLYRHPKTLWMLCPLMLYWVSMVWLRCTRGEMHDDPIVFAIKDRVSLTIGAIGALILVLASR